MEFLLRSTHTCNSWIIRSMHCTDNLIHFVLMFGVIVISWVVFSCLVVIVSGVRAIHQLSLSTSPTLCSHPGPGYWPVIFIITTYYLEQEKSRYITCYIHPVCPDPLSSSSWKQRNVKLRSQLCPWLWGLGCQQWIRGRENCPSVSYSVLTQSTFPTQNRDPVFCYC